jgi:hypothetical protein
VTVLYRYSPDFLTEFLDMEVEKVWWMRAAQKEGDFNLEIRREDSTVTVSGIFPFPTLFSTWSSSHRTMIQIG